MSPSRMIRLPAVRRSAWMAFTLSNWPLTSSRTLRSSVCTVPAGVIRFWAASSRAIICGVMPSVASRAGLMSMWICSGCTPTSSILATSGTFSSSARMASACRRRADIGMPSPVSA